MTCRCSRHLTLDHKRALTFLHCVYLSHARASTGPESLSHSFKRTCVIFRQPQKCLYKLSGIDEGFFFPPKWNLYGRSQSGPGSTFTACIDTMVELNLWTCSRGWQPHNLEIPSLNLRSDLCVLPMLSFHKAERDFLH